MTFAPHHPFVSAAARDGFLALYEERAKRWPVPCEERFVDTSFGKTFVRVTGPEDAPPLVLLHGATGNSLNWTPNVRRLSEVFRVFTLDCFYGWGKADWTKIPKDGEAHCVWLCEALDGLGLRARVHLAGVSYGGWITGEFAQRRPERLRSAVLIAPGGVLQFNLSFIPRMLICLIPHRYFTRNFIRWLFADWALRGEECKKLVDEWADDSYLAARWFVRQPVANLRVFEDADLAGLTVPTLCLVGENEKVYSAAKAIARLGRVAPKIETAVIKNAGHDVSFAQPEIVNEKLIAFSQRF